MDLYLFNTMSRSLERFEPLDSKRVGVYTCGPTVYHHAHIGNLRTYIFADVLVRTLRMLGHQVCHVMNITDVGHLTSDADEGEDKMAVGAAREGITAWEIADRYTRSFFEQCGALNIVRPSIVCRATDHIEQQIEMIVKLSDRGYTYCTSDGVYFDTSKVDSYGELARLKPSGQMAGARVDLGQKRNNTDFALWKFSPEGTRRQMEWPSPWGTGFPGWHIECSAMAAFYLGDQFDIHTGGIDHIPVHHTNEIVQSECATGVRPFVKYWLHGNFLQIAGDARMAKSSGDFITVSKLRDEDFDPLAFRFLCFRAHYRSEMKFSWEILRGSATSYRRLLDDIATLGRSASSPPSELGDDETIASEPKCREYGHQVMRALCEDLNTPIALTVLQRAIKDGSLSAESRLALVRHFDAVFGLDLLNGRARVADEIDIEDDVRAIVDARTEARARGDWALADELRAKIESRGYRIEDTPQGPQLART